MKKIFFVIFWNFLVFLVLTNRPALSFDEIDLKKFQARNVCEGCDLTDVNLIDANLSGANLSKANLTDANLSNANLSYLILSGANLSDVNFFDSIFCKTQTPWGEDNSGCEN